jgi:large subunit ribosomal protein L24
MKLRKNDPVIVIAGKDKGKKGKILNVYKKTNKVLVEGVNKVKRHVKPGTITKEGGIISIEKPIDVSNVMYFDEKSSKATRIGYKLIDGKKYRISRKSGDVIEG